MTQHIPQQLTGPGRGLRNVLYHNYRMKKYGAEDLVAQIQQMKSCMLDLESDKLPHSMLVLNRTSHTIESSQLLQKLGIFRKKYVKTPKAMNKKTLLVTPEIDLSTECATPYVVTTTYLFRTYTMRAGLFGKYCISHFVGLSKIISNFKMSIFGYQHFKE